MWSHKKSAEKCSFKWVCWGAEFIIEKVRFSTPKLSLQFELWGAAKIGENEVPSRRWSVYVGQSKPRLNGNRNLLRSIRRIPHALSSQDYSICIIKFLLLPTAIYFTVPLILHFHTLGFNLRTAREAGQMVVEFSCGLDCPTSNYPRKEGNPSMLPPLLTL